MTAVLTETTLDLPLYARGKVRDIYEVPSGPDSSGGDKLLIVATDRLSAFDHVLPTPIPDKGRVLTQLSAFWFEKLHNVVPHHVLTTTEFTGELAPHADILRGRAMLVRKTEPLPIECVVRGYLSGSGWKEYKASGRVCGIPLPVGLRESDELPEPIFTPATKEEVGTHDENISFERMAEIVGHDTAARVRDLSIKIYQRAAFYAESRGIILADTKMEFGVDENGTIILIDELLTPDSSRFWPKDKYLPGRGQESFDKQFVRDYLNSIAFNRKPPAPALPEDIVFKTSALYLEALKRLSGKTLV